MASNHRLTLIAPSKEAWDAQNETDTHLFGRPINYDVLDFEHVNGTTTQVVIGPLEELNAIEAAAKAAGWSTTLEDLAQVIAAQRADFTQRTGRTPEDWLAAWRSGALDNSLNLTQAQALEIELLSHEALNLENEPEGTDGL